MKLHPAVCAAALLLVACTRAPAPIPAPAKLGPIAVFPPLNLTGDELVVSGGTMLEKYALGLSSVTVGDVLATEARLQLEARGRTVVAPEIVAVAVGDRRPTSAQQAAKLAATAKLDAAVLYIQIRRWEPDVPFHPSFIIVSLAATLIDPSDNRVLWIDDVPSRPIPTRGVVNPGEASVIAAAKVTEMLLEGFGTAPPEVKP